jgi:hypothetical protein
VILFPADQSRWFRFEESSGLNRLTVRDGAYRYTDIAPGDYYAVALDDYRGSLSPAFARSVIPIATRVSIADGAAKTLNLVVRSPE